MAKEDSVQHKDKTRELSPAGTYQWSRPVVTTDIPPAEVVPFESHPYHQSTAAAEAHDRAMQDKAEKDEGLVDGHPAHAAGDGARPPMVHPETGKTAPAHAPAELADEDDMNPLDRESRPFHEKKAAKK